MPPFDRDTFRLLRGRTFGSANPQRIRNEYWEYMVRSGEGPYRIRELLQDPRDYCNSAAPDPDWCFQRFGTSRTELTDGRVIYVAGEHEDHYDPDFCIYNDVIVVRPARGADHTNLSRADVEIYGYPRHIFPPTDFHSATLVGSWIYLIGNLGYPEDRKHQSTQVYRLSTRTYEIERISTCGTKPGWIHKHHASFEPGLRAISVRGGKRLDSDDSDLAPQTGFFRLHLEDNRWELVRSGEPSRTLQLLPRREWDGDWSLPKVEALRPKSVPHRFLPEGWTGSPYHPAPPALEVSGVRIDFHDMVSEYELQFAGALSPKLHADVLGEIQRAIEAETRTGWMFKVARNAD